MLRKINTIGLSNILAIISAVLLALVFICLEFITPNIQAGYMILAIAFSSVVFVIASVVVSLCKPKT